ncbi:NADase-type glycan-binding domain-containing protein [Streptomyces massasporeus]|uniref:NADase-type glycan-binding domain-containing protein n=1 Tax=Streptomyces massasporeus TaxID=67324 RepID=UPI0034064825
MTTPQNCADCGTRAQPGQSFCDACGSVLSWTDGAARTAGDTGTGSPGPAGAAGGSAGAAATTPPPTTASAASASAASVSPDPHPGWDAFSRPDGGTGLPRTSRDRTGASSTAHTTASRATAPPVSGTTEEAPVRAAQGPEPATTSAQPADHRPGAADGTPHPHTAPHPAADDTAPTQPVPPATHAPNPSTTQGINTRARLLLVPVTDGEPRPAAEPSVAPVLPGRPTPLRPEAVRAPGEEHGIDGGTACPWCATRNRPERHFCARCAMPMAGDGPAPVQLPWWRRLGPFGSRETPWAGDRPRLRRTFDRVLSWLGIAVVLALLIALVVNIPQGIQATRDHFAKRAPVSPDRYSASRSYPGHKPDLVFDKLNDSWWGPGVSESAQGQYIEARFDEPTRLLDLIITPGTSTRADQLSKSALPHRLTATVTGKDGRTTTRSLTLDQGAGPQRRAFRVGEVTAVRFTIDSAYGTSAKKQVAIAEIEFFGPSSANNS